MDKSTLFAGTFSTAKTKLKISDSSFRYMSNQALFSNFNKLKIKSSTFSDTKAVTLNGDASYVNQFFSDYVEKPNEYVYFVGCYFYSSTGDQLIQASRIYFTNCYSNSSGLAFRKANIVQLEKSYFMNYAQSFQQVENLAVNQSSIIAYLVEFTTSANPKYSYNFANISRLVNPIISPIKTGTLDFSYTVFSQSNSEYGLKIFCQSLNPFTYFTMQNCTYEKYAITSNRDIEIQNLCYINTQTGKSFFSSTENKLTIIGLYSDCDLVHDPEIVNITNSFRYFSHEMPKFLPIITNVPDPDFFDYRIHRNKQIKFAKYLNLR